LERLFTKSGICVAVKEKLTKDSGVAGAFDYNHIVDKLLAKPKARGNKRERRVSIERMFNGFTYGTLSVLLTMFTLTFILTIGYISFLIFLKDSDTSGIFLKENNFLLPFWSNHFEIISFCIVASTIFISNQL
jgi:hypothetical protein